MQKNLIMAIVLSVVVLLLYNIFVAGRKPALPPSTEEATESPIWEGEAPQEGEILPSSQLEKGEEIILENEYIKVVLTSRGGIVKSWYLKKEKKELVGRSTYSLGLNLFLPEGERINLLKEDFEVHKEGERKAVLIWQDEEGRFKLFKNFEISKLGYHIFLSIQTQNLPLGSSYELTWPSMIGDEYKEGER